MLLHSSIALFFYLMTTAGLFGSDVTLSFLINFNKKKTEELQLLLLANLIDHPQKLTNLHYRTYRSKLAHSVVMLANTRVMWTP